MEFVVCKNGHTKTVMGWTNWLRVAVDISKGGCMKCHYGGK